MPTVFLTGATGFVGRHVAAELRAHGWAVHGLARSVEAVRKLESSGVTPVRGSLTDYDVLKKAASGAARPHTDPSLTLQDAVIHTGFIHDFSNFMESCRIEGEVIDAFGQALAGSNKPFVAAAAVASHQGLGRPITEDDRAPQDFRPSENATLKLSERGIKSAVVRLSPTTHGEGDWAFMPMIVQADIKAGYAAYVGDGQTRWPAVNVKDAAALFRLALDPKVPAGTALNAVESEGYTQQQIASYIASKAGIPTKSITSDEAQQMFQFLAKFIAWDAPANSDKTRSLTGWKPSHPDLFHDIEAFYIPAARSQQ